MKSNIFKYELPKERIAQYPPRKRGTTKLLIVDRKKKIFQHKNYFNVVDYIKKGDIVVLNETKVQKRRTFFITEKGKKIEVLFLENRKEKDGLQTWFCLVGRAKDVKEGEVLRNKEVFIKVLRREEDGFLINIPVEKVNVLFEKYGHTPLPPYMKREDRKSDQVRYNTVFSRILGSVAAPTASLNLTKDILKKIQKKGAEIVKIDLEVGWGTFAPVREENIEEHKLHKEYIRISKEAADKINNRKGDVWAFGTTVCRAIESSAKRGKVVPFEGYTDLYIYPGYRWKIVDHLVTNFHMPDSSLILMVSSFMGINLTKKAYKEALSKDYKFLSYGDSMLIL
jgi:S-adenosylmethionine:tRNA ribosyltransferase-isomerase